MASSDWTFVTDSLDAATVDRGVSAGFTPPNGGGSFVYGFNSLAVTLGAVALFTNQANFAPTSALKGGVLTGAIKRAISGGALNFAPFLFIGLQGTTINDNGYLLGLGDGDPHHIVLRKGRLVDGVPDSAPGVNGVLRRSSATFSPDTWLHLRIDMIVNVNTDVRLQMFRNNLNANPVSSPVWVAEPGLEEFVDDALGVNSGSQPYTTSRFGFGFYSKDVSRRGFFDHITVARQL